MPHKIIYIGITCMLLACYSFSRGEGAGRTERSVSAVPLKKDVWQTLSLPCWAAFPSAVTPGEYTTIVYVGGENRPNRVRRANLYNAAGKKLAGAAFFRYELDEAGHTIEAAFLAPPSTSAGGSAYIAFEEDGVEQGMIPFIIKKRDFTAETIPLDEGNTNIRTVPDPRKTAESQRLWAILSTTGSEVWAQGVFTTPVPANTRRSSFFGDRRVYKYSTGKTDTSVHAGIDYAVPRGTPVHACAAGKVALASPRIVTGNSIVLEHLPGIYSLYYHLDKIAVAEGALVKKGDLIGYSGSTGLSTGPHLHWEIRVSTENADPDAFCTRSALDRGAILSWLFTGRE